MQNFASSYKLVKVTEGSSSKYFLRLTMDATGIDTTQFVDNLNAIDTLVVLRSGSQTNFTSIQECPNRSALRMCQKTNRQPYFCGENCDQSLKYLLKI